MILIGSNNHRKKDRWPTIIDVAPFLSDIAGAYWVALYWCTYNPYNYVGSLHSLLQSHSLIHFANKEVEVGKICTHNLLPR